jgi:rubrerythrin
MPRPRSLHTLFLGLLTGCGSGTSTTSASGDTFETAECPNDNNTYEQDYEAPLSQVEPLVGADGDVLPEHCNSLCTEQQGGGDVLGCTLLDEVTPTSGGGMTSGNESATEPTTGGDDSTSGGDGTGGEDSSGGTSAAETTGDGMSGGTVGTTGMEETVTLRCEFVEYCLGGRGHGALRSRPSPRGEDRLGRWLAATAHSEAASVVAFLAMADELATHGAPDDLVRRAWAAAADEVEHARAMTRLAHARGVGVRPPRFDAIEVRDLTTIAIENAVEGCVRETWAALEAAHQARHAADPGLRRVMVCIAADETRHAELSHDLDGWIRTRLDDEAVGRVDAAKARAVRGLLDRMHGERNPQLCAQAGLPAAATARRLCEALREELWA